jgi:hypothetical protein
MARDHEHGAAHASPRVLAAAGDAAGALISVSHIID